MNWQTVLSDATNERMFDLARERGISPGMFIHLRHLRLLGWFDGGPAFPIANPAGEVIGCHSRRPLVKDQRKNWHYEWFGKQKGVSPLVLGNLETAVEVWIFESQWDAIATLAIQGWHTTPLKQQQVAAVSTRGAENGARIRGLIPVGKRILAFTQNDQPKNPGKPPAAEKWLADVVAHAGSPVMVVSTPPEFKDMNEWVKAGANLRDLQTAITTAHLANITHPPSIDGISFDDQHEEADDEDVPFPTETLPPPYSDMVREVARVMKVPEALPATVILAAISTSVGQSIQSPDSDRTIPRHADRAD